MNIPAQGFSILEERLRRLYFAVGVLLSILTFGTIGFLLTEPSIHSVFDSFYFTVVTVFTIGYGDFVPTTTAAKAVAIVTIIGGVGTGLYVLQMVLELTVTKRLRTELGLPIRRTRMRDHYIICGYGRVGRQVMAQLSRKGERFIFIEHDKDKVEEMVEQGVPVIQGDAAEEEALLKANIREAKCLIATMRDPQNMVAVITAKILNPSIYAVAEVEEEPNTEKLRKVGADATVNCHQTGARIMVNQARRVRTDPVCGDELAGAKEEFSITYGGQRYLFCSKECMEAFGRKPERFIEGRLNEEICVMPGK
jgi:voltage-gated potassium channel